MSRRLGEPHSTYSRDEVAKHNKLGNAWVTHKGYVYDITGFLDQHPGGREIMKEYLGKDVESPMKDADHSSYAYNALKECVIGIVEGCEPSESHAPPRQLLRGYTAEQLRSAIDWTRPTLMQVATMGDKYWPWIVSRPVCVKNIIFGTSFLEALTHYKWWYIWPMWLPVSSALTLWEFQEFGLASTFSWYIFGMFVWTFAEYCLHRFIFHFEVNSNPGNVFHYFAHGLHHLTPTDSSRLTFPIPFGWLLAFIISSFMSMLTVHWQGLFGGFLLGYLFYDTFHFLFHHTDFDNKIFKRIKSSHLNHHYKDENTNFGVTSPLWDIVFGTYDPLVRMHGKDM